MIIILALVLPLIPSFCTALDSYTYEEFVSAIELCDEQKIIELKKLYLPTAEEREQLYALAHQTAVELQSYKKRFYSNYYRHLFFPHKLPKALHKLTQTKRTYMNCRLFLGSSLALMAMIPVLAYAPLPTFLQKYPRNKLCAFAVALFGYGIVLPCAAVWISGRIEPWDYEEEVTTNYATALRIMVLLDT